MNDSEKRVNEEIKNNLDKLKTFFINNFNLFLIALLAITFILRLKFMNVNAAVWWDEADYLTLAKHYAFGLPSDAAPWRAKAITLVWAFFYKLGATEWFVRLFGQIITVAGVYITYRLGKDLFNRYVGLIAGFMMAFFWLPMFWATRVSLGIYAIVFWGAAALLFWHGYVLKKSKWYLFGSGAIIAFGIFAYESVGFIIPFLFIYLLVSDRFRFLKSKKMLYFVIGGILLATPFLMWNYSDFKDDFDNPIFSLYPRFGRTYDADIATNEQMPTQQWQRPFSAIVKDLSFFYGKLPYLIKWPFVIALIFGLSSFVNMFLGFDMLLKGKSLQLKKQWFIFSWAFFGSLIVSLLYTFTNFGFEPRLWMPAFPAIFVIAALGIVNIFNLIKKHNKEIALLVILVILIAGAYSNYNFGKSLIEQKKNTYLHEKLAGNWIKENSQPGDILTGCGLAVPLTYYSERSFKAYKYDNITFMNEVKPKFFVMDFYDPNCKPQEYLQKHQDKIKPVQVYFFDKEQKQPIIVIFSIEYPIN